MNFFGVAIVCEAFVARRHKFKKQQFRVALTFCPAALLLSACSGAAGSGPSMTRYCTIFSWVVLHLEPTSFANVGARDFWYARYRQFIEIKWRHVLDDVQSEYSESSGESGNCKDGVTKARLAREQ